MPFARSFGAAGWSVTFAIPHADALPDNARALLGDHGEVLPLSAADLAGDDAAFAADAIGVFSTGSTIARFRRLFADAAARRGGTRPAIFTGFNGLVYEKFEEGLAWRLGYDVVALNGDRDLAMAREMLGADDGGQHFVVTGLRPGARVAQGGQRDRMLLFAEQVAVPDTPAERTVLVVRLAEVARANPGWKVVVKPRIRPGEATFHGEVADLGALIAQSSPPKNLVIDHSPLPNLLARAGIFTTISSTALFEALDAGVPSFVVGDFGIRNAFGTHVLVNSGLFRTLEALGPLDELVLPGPAADWCAWVGHGIDGMEALRGALTVRGMRTGDLPPTLESLHDIAPSNGLSARFDQSMLQACNNFAANRFAQAESDFSDAASAHPRSTRAWRSLAEAQIAQGRLAAARQSLRTAAQLKPGNRNIARRLSAISFPARFFPGLRTRGRFDPIA